VTRTEKATFGHVLARVCMGAWGKAGGRGLQEAGIEDVGGQHFVQELREQACFKRRGVGIAQDNRST